MKQNFFTFLIVSILIILLGSCRISKGFEALGEYNYFEAKKQFEKSIKKQKSPAAYGLSIIYFRKDNPFHHLDSAYHYGLLAVESYADAKVKHQEKWEEKFNFTLDKAKQQRKLISDLAYQTAIQQNKVDAYQDFIVNYPWSAYRKSAEVKRDSLAFIEAKTMNTSRAFAVYLDRYSDSRWNAEAQQLFYEAQYKETVRPGETKSYMNFIRNFPENSLLNEAYYQVFIIETKENSIQAYHNFIRDFSDNPHQADAWIHLYRLSVANYTRENILQFSEDYPHFPFPELIEQDLQLVGQSLLQFFEDGKYGFMNENGEEMIAPTFKYAGQFKNGLAAVVQKNHWSETDGKDQYGFINKNGKLIIDYQFDEVLDFDQGRAIVGVNDQYGVIDVSGGYVIAPKYKDIGGFFEGLSYVQNEKGYQYYTLEGTIAFPTVFDEAFSFSNGLAKVKLGNKKGFISEDGTFVCSVTVGDLRHFKDSIFIHEFRDSVSLMYANGQYLSDRTFDKVGVLKNNRAIVEKNKEYGYIDGKGELVIPIKFVPFANYVQFGQFENQHSIYKKGQKYAMMDSLGNPVLPALFDGIGVYGELIPVTKGKEWGYTNKEVRLKIDYQFDYAYAFIEGTAIVEKNSLSGLINLNAEEIIPVQFESIKRLEDNLLLVKSGGLLGLFSTAGDTLVQPQYDRIHKVSNYLYQLIEKQEISYYDVSKNRLITLKD